MISGEFSVLVGLQRPAPRPADRHAAVGRRGGVRLRTPSASDRLSRAPYAEDTRPPTWKSRCPFLQERYDYVDRIAPVQPGPGRPGRSRSSVRGSSCPVEKFVIDDAADADARSRSEPWNCCSAWQAGQPPERERRARPWRRRRRSRSPRGAEPGKSPGQRQSAQDTSRARHAASMTNIETSISSPRYLDADGSGTIPAAPPAAPVCRRRSA